jgi:hypothetical protein
VLNHYFVRPTTVDRIRERWIGEPIERYVTWLNRYAEITLRTKKAALDKCTLSTSPDERIPRKPRWQTDDSLMDRLKSL